MLLITSNAFRHARFPRIAAPALLALLSASALFAQSMSAQSFEPEYLDPVVGPGQSGATPRLLFELAAEIPLPGPLPGSGPRLVEDGIEIAISGGTALSAWEPEASIRLVPGDPLDSSGSVDPPPEVDAWGAEYAWGFSPNGRFRAAVLPSGHVLLQKKCRRCTKGWNKKWKLRVPGRAIAPPLVTERRVFYGAMNNRVYAVKRKNGHRVWEADVEGRASRDLVYWPPPFMGSSAASVEFAPNSPVELVMVVPDSGKILVALDARSGARVAEYELKEDQGMLVGGALVTPDGKVVVAWQKYSPAEASLMVFDLARVPEEPKSDAAAEAPEAEPAAQPGGSVL